ncbi:MAG: TrkA C-terminal domain-containing protein [Syntrophomonadaceae bacterium]|nr:TrkA C-terminal domain-containing protein [Syntrophomonadaceae bacterium]
MGQRIDSPRYMSIALDLAGRICNGEFKEGHRIFGRSTLASEYNVSPETIRRAVNLLEDMHVVNSNQGSGIFISSQNNAHAFVKKFQNKETIRTLKNEMKELLLQKQGIENSIIEKIEKIVDYSDRLKNLNILTPLEIEIDDTSRLIGHTITETEFWQNTGATIVAIKRNDTLILSPGPYGGFEKGDSIFVIGDTGIIDRIKGFMREYKPKRYS